MSKRRHDARLHCVPTLRMPLRLIMHDEYSFRYIWSYNDDRQIAALRQRRHSGRIPFAGRGLYRRPHRPERSPPCSSPGATYYARVRDYYLVEEELEQGDGILFDTRLAPRTGDLAFCEVCGERVLKYIRKRGRELWLLGGGTDDTLPVDGDTEARVLGVVTVVIKVRRFKRQRLSVATRRKKQAKEKNPCFHKLVISVCY